MAKDDKSGAAAPKFKVTKRIVVPTMKVVDDKEIFVRFEEAIEKRKKVEEVNGKPEEKTIEIARVTNLETGEVCEIVAGTVLMSELNETYPDGGYVGKSFRIMKKKVEGKRYKTYELDEIEWQGNK